MSIARFDEIDTKTLFAQPPPKFGHDLLQYFSLDPNYVNLNHGSFGSSPLVVLKAIHDLTLEIESNPDLFHRITLHSRHVEAREQIAKLIGAKTGEVFFTSNTSLGVNTILRNIEWEKGDTILVTNTTYTTVFRTSQHLSNALPHPNLEVLTLHFPLTHAEILAQFQEKVRSLPGGKHRVAVIDAIASNPGVYMPWKEMVNICAEEGVLSVVDAAHAIGQEVGIDVTDAKPDFWVSNLHKWLYVKRSCAALYIPERNQPIIKSSIPTSYAYRPAGEQVEGLGLAEQFEWNGTIDYSHPLSVPTALAFRAWIGGEESINEYCHALALQGGRRLAEILGTRVMDPQGDLTLNMVNVELPLPLTEDLPYEEVYMKIQDRLLRNFKVYTAYFAHNGNVWTRCSAQVYNEITDFEKAGEVWLQICKEIVEEYKLPSYGIKN